MAFSSRFCDGSRASIGTNTVRLVGHQVNLEEGELNPENKQMKYHTRINTYICDICTLFILTPASLASDHTVAPFLMSSTAQALSHGRTISVGPG